MEELKRMYRVDVFMELGGSYWIEANSMKRAEEIAESMLEEGEEFEIVCRNYGLIGARIEI